MDTSFPGELSALVTYEKLDRLAPRVVVLVPQCLLTAIFAAGLWLLVGLPHLDSTERSTLLILTGAAYLVAVGTITHAGFAKLERMERLTATDSLTGLGNRRALHNRFANTGSLDEEAALAMIDLDGFKPINDHYSHIVGDQVIKACADILQEVCRKEATCYRLGGDEFAIAMIGPLAGNIIEGMSRAIIDRLALPIIVDDRRLSLGASIGLTRVNKGNSISSSEMLRQADIALYASKRGGSMRCTWFNAEFDRNREALRLMDDELRVALMQGDFALHYQPLVDAQSKQIVAVESLLRWNRRDGPRVGPDVFIPVAESSGFINAIGLWVLRQACTDALQWPDIKLSVNISAAQLRNAEFPVQLGQILEETGFPPERLELEITETCLVLDPQIAERSLDLVRGFGVNVALDDFGTGYASIGFLRQFRFEKLKLDRSLVTQAEDDPASLAMMLSSITVARAMDMDVTAEGVETEEQAAMVRAAGCDQIQGWLYYKAMPADEIPQFLHKDPRDDVGPTLNEDRKIA